eukprot:2993227-Pleurochrysis_carterae.AAC.4
MFHAEMRCVRRSRVNQPFETSGPRLMQMISGAYHTTVTQCQADTVQQQLTHNDFTSYAKVSRF